MKLPRLSRAGLFLLAGLLGCDAGSGPGALPAPGQAPSPPPSPQPSPSPAPANLPPRLEVRVTPTPIGGGAPLSVYVNLCRSSDPDADRLSYVFEYQGEGKRFTSHCEERHVYTTPVNSQAVFCVSDGMPRHLICRSFRVTLE
jgi:hypothetical protein